MTVSGPEGFVDRAFTASATLEDLEPGVYDVSAQDVTESTDTYVASIMGSPVTIAAGKTRTATVTYERFGAAIDDHHLVVPFDGSRDVHLDVVRSGGFEGDVLVSIDDVHLPAGVTVSATHLTIPADETDAAHVHQNRHRSRPERAGRSTCDRHGCRSSQRR